MSFCLLYVASYVASWLMVIDVFLIRVLLLLFCLCDVKLFSCIFM